VYKHPNKRAQILYDTLLKLKDKSPKGVIRCSDNQLAALCGIAIRTLVAAINDLTHDNILIANRDNIKGSRSNSWGEYTLLEREDNEFKP
jgi:hypothetical protein